MGVQTNPCLVVLAAYSLILIQANITPVLAHVINQTESPATAAPQAPPPVAPVAPVRSAMQPLQATDLLTADKPCSHGLERQMPYFGMGAPGPSGSAGIPGLPGAGGAQGARGERGDRGEPGLSGFPGSKGDKGDIGAVGPQGLVGLEGLNGTKGVKGEPGRDYTPPSMSAFHVGQSSNLQVTSGSQIISFNAQYINIGDDMSQHTGVFTCRIPGLYYFTYTFRAYSHGSYGLNIDLLVNNVVKSQIYMTAMSKHLMQTQSTIVTLRVGDDVWLKANANTYINGDDEMNVFSGYLINAI
ncbi:uncharacterized protein [Amphiura filiformis]|uniref:uncharacterized protein n=1 Tax=Amphiura filiformis TaxID=82378 RepID=UPI003B2184CD